MYYLEVTVIPISILRPYFHLIKNKKDILPDLFQGKDRLYIPFQGNIGGKPHWTIRTWLKSNGYKLVDYKKGLVQNIQKGSPIRLGKLLRIKKMDSLLKIYENDSFRSAIKQDEFLIVLSRHPYDLLGMSIGRGWTSCFNLENERTKHKLIFEIERDDIVFYLCKKNDTNIQNPIGRLLFGLNENNLYTLRTNIYGSYTEGFAEACNKFLCSHGYGYVCKIRSTQCIENYFTLKKNIVVNRDSSNWRERLEYFKQTKSILAKYDKHHLIRYLYYSIYDDSDAKFDDNISIRYLYYIKNCTCDDILSDPDIKIRKLYNYILN